MGGISSRYLRRKTITYGNFTPRSHCYCYCNYNCNCNYNYNYNYNYNCFYHYSSYNCEIQGYLGCAARWGCAPLVEMMCLSVAAWRMLSMGLRSSLLRSP